MGGRQVGIDCAAWGRETQTQLRLSKAQPGAGDLVTEVICKVIRRPPVMGCSLSCRRQMKAGKEIYFGGSSQAACVGGIATRFVGNKGG